MKNVITIEFTEPANSTNIGYVANLFDRCFKDLALQLHTKRTHSSTEDLKTETIKYTKNIDINLASLVFSWIPVFIAANKNPKSYYNNVNVKVTVDCDGMVESSDYYLGE